MRRLTIVLVAVLCAAWGLCSPHRAHAASGAAAPAEESDLLCPSALGEALSEEGLAGQDGRQDTQIDQITAQITDAKNNATVTGNTLSAMNSVVTTGVNSIGNAFANANGIVTVIQNSGNQVLIQSDMVLNLFVK